VEEIAAGVVESDNGAQVQQTAATSAPASSDAGIRFETINQVIQERCSVCHSASPTHAAFAAAPAGVILDTPEEIKANVPRIIAQTVTTKVMPLGNLTQMTDDERTLIGDWAAQGAKLQ